LGYAHIKAARRTLMKLTTGAQKQDLAFFLHHLCTIKPT